MSLPGALTFRPGYFTDTTGLGGSHAGINTSYNAASTDEQQRAVADALAEQLQSQNRLDPRVDYAGPLSPYSANHEGFVSSTQASTMTPAAESNAQRAQDKAQNTGIYSDEYVLKTLAPEVYAKILGTSK